MPPLVFGHGNKVSIFILDRTHVQSRLAILHFGTSLWSTLLHFILILGLWVQAARLIEEEVRYLKNAMGHEDASEEDYAEARDGCVDDLVYFPSRENFGLVSVASTNDRLAALQYEFEVVKKHMEAETRKAVRMEHKVKVLTHGYQVRMHLLS